jgi:hypothetical protein
MHSRTTSCHTVQHTDELLYQQWENPDAPMIRTPSARNGAKAAPIRKCSEGFNDDFNDSCMMGTSASGYLQTDCHINTRAHKPSETCVHQHQRHKHAVIKATLGIRRSFNACTS